MRDLAIKGIEGVLPTGLPVVRKVRGDERMSACVLVRGAAGVGKTLFAAHLAISEAARLGGDVVYCLVEELPTELAAQLAGLSFGAERFTIPVTYHTCVETGEAVKPSPRLHAGLIDVPLEGEPAFGDEVLRVIEEARSVGLLPVVVVVDALSEGYRIGGAVSRPLADDVAKHATGEGLVMILTEEIAAGEIGVTGDVWTFVADVVLDLSLTPDGQRTLVARKNRFGPSATAPFDFGIRSAGGVEICPRCETPDEAVAATVRTLRQRLRVAEPVYRAALALHSGASETPEAREQLRLAVDRARETERLIASGWSISDLAPEELP